MEFDASVYVALILETIPGHVCMYEFFPWPQYVLEKLLFLSKDGQEPSNVEKTAVFSGFYRICTKNA